MVKSKKGWLKIAEAAIAITILAGVLLVLYSIRTPEINLEEPISLIQDQVLTEIVTNSEYRMLAFESNGEMALDYLMQDYFPYHLNFKIKICDINEEDIASSCNLEGDILLSLLNKDIYAKETFISAQGTTYDPKIVKIFVWEGNERSIIEEECLGLNFSIENYYVVEYPDGDETKFEPKFTIKNLEESSQNITGFNALVYKEENLYKILSHTYMGLSIEPSQSFESGTTRLNNLEGITSYKIIPKINSSIFPLTPCYNNFYIQEAQ